MDWRRKWEAALSKIECSRGVFTCIRHFSSDDLIKKKDKHILQPMAVPRIFDTHNKTSCDSVAPKNDAVFIQTSDDLIVQRNIAVPIQKSVTAACNCASMEQTIQMQLNAISSQEEKINQQAIEIMSLKNMIQTKSADIADMKRIIQARSNQILAEKEIVKRQFNKILSLKTTIQTQSDKIQNLTAQLSTLTSKLECPLVKFAIEANDTKVLKQTFPK